MPLSSAYHLLFEGEALTFSKRENGVGLARFARPESMNTLTLEMIGELDKVMDLALADGLRALILTGSGDSFCAGAPLAYFSDPKSLFFNRPDRMRDDYVGAVIKVFDRLEAMPFPVIAAINGHALGGGCEMALSCDLRVMASGGRIGVPEVRVGIFPAGGGVQKLHRVVGRGKALEMILLGQKLDAATAEHIGLVAQATAPEALLPAAEAMADEIIKAGPYAIAQAKAMIYANEIADRADANAQTLDAFAKVAASPDWREGASAFLEKRKPRF